MSIRVENNIVQLLRKHDCVIVPDFGGFVLSRKPAYFSAGSHELCPPAKHLGFNRSLNHNDGLLASTISQEINIPFDEALRFVEEQAQRWKTTLDTEGTLEMEGLGRFQMAEENKWSFSPAQEQPFLLSSYGLGNVQLIPLESTSQQKILTPAEPFKQLKKLGKARRRVWTPKKVAAAFSIAVFLAAGSFFGYQQMKQQQKFATASILDTAEPKKDSPIAIINSIVNDTKLAPQKTVGTAPKQHFYVIGGSFSKKHNAQKLANELKAKGYQAEVLNNESGFFRVTYLTESDSLAADQQLKDIRSKENSTAWLLKW